MACDYKEYRVVVLASGKEIWYYKDLVHRENGPAIVYPNGDKYWYRRDLLHREDGPAIEYRIGSKFWYLNGLQYTQREWEAELNRVVKIEGRKYQLKEI